jgi:hypothetical protein
VEIFRESDTAHRPPRGKTRFVRREATPDVFILEQREMGSDFAISLAVGAILPKDVEQSKKESTHIPDQSKVESLQVKVKK